MTNPLRSEEGFPRIRTVGLQGMLVTFADTLSEAANRATLAYRAALEAALPVGVLETSASLTSVFVRFDPNMLRHEALRENLAALLASRDWMQAALPVGRTLWRVPTVYGTDLAPQLAEAADAAGLNETEAVASLSGSRVRVLTIGFAPGQPYLGPLGPEWNLPRQTDLTPRVPAGALILAISQFVLFSAPNPTGWRHVGQTGFRVFKADRDAPFALKAGDEMQFEAVTRAEYLRLAEKDPSYGCATRQEIRA